MIQAAGGDAFLASSLVCFYISDGIIYLMYGAIVKGDIAELYSSWKAKSRLGAKILGAILLNVWLATKLLSPCTL